MHIILVSKYRKAVFFGSFRNDIKQYIFEICTDNHWYIRRMETDRDHIHILLQYSPADSVSEIISKIKQYSTYLAWKHHETFLRKIYRGGKFLWSDGYFASTIGQVSQATIERYIENQG